jgi:2'-5' RNA ligase
MRAFFCLPLDADVRAGIARTAERIRREARMSASWVEPDNYHITLRFLGDIDPSSTVRLKSLAAEAAGECGAFSIALREIGAFPSIDRARVLWVGGQAPEGFRVLVESLNKSLADLGFPDEPKPAAAHATIARLKGAPDRGLVRMVEAMGGLALRDSTPDHVLLMQSELTPRGARYTPLFSVQIPGQTEA